MKFRPCIDIHNGRVKQIVGSSLEDFGDQVVENFVSKRDADFFADFFRKQGLSGGHVIMLNKSGSPFYEATKQQAMKALQTYPEGFQIGGGIKATNAEEYIRAGASHVIVTSYIFSDGQIQKDHLQALVSAVGKEHIVIDLSCKKRLQKYFVTTDRWQKYTHAEVDIALLDELSDSCDEFLVHAADVEGKTLGIDEELVEILAQWDGIPITYAGGVSDYDDIIRMRDLGQSKIDLTIGSALDIYGGKLHYETVLDYFREI